jgi:drug/metabolite transporter (DMT)-like permease
MRSRDFTDLVLLAALWGGSFLFTRMAVPAFGPFALAEIRVAIAALMLLPLLAWRSGIAELSARPAQFVLLGAINTALPFALFAYAALSITAGMASILNATVPLFGALVARVWLRDRLLPLQWLGLVVGMAGVWWLSANQASFSVGGSNWAIAAGLAASLSYAVSASLVKRRFSGVPSLAVAAGSQLTAALLLAPFAFAYWPLEPISTGDWAAAIALGVLCTGLAYLLYFRLIERAGPARALTVTYLIPGFAMLWGALFLDERITPAMLAGCAVILIGTALATGLLRSPRTVASAR